MSIHVDEGYTDPRLASLYDAECPWHPQDDFYQALDLTAGSVLDVGCGTGTRLVSTRERGHTGDLVGVDPAPGMLGIARAKSDRVTWVDGAAQTLDLGRRFDLLTMTGHAFQTLLDDEAVVAALRAFHRHLGPEGLLAFETRNPAARAWERWTADATRATIADPAGAPYETWVGEAGEVAPHLVRFASCTRDLVSGEVHVGWSTLRFVDPDRLRGLLRQCGFRVEGWYGDWDRSPVTPTSPEIVVLARPAA